MIANFATALGHHQANRLAEAEAGYRAVLASQPNHADALHLLGVLAAQIGRFDDAVDLISRACALRPNVADYLTHLGNALGEKKDFPAAIDAYRRALRLSPRCPISHDGLGAALRETGELDEAVACHRRSLAINPGNAIAHYNLGLTLAKEGSLKEADGSYRRAIQLAPDFADAHWNLALLLLMQGDFEQGWREYEWRWRRAKFPALWPPLLKPQWDGGPLAGKRLLVHTEQGYGDAIQFVRYAPLLVERGATVLLLCQTPLARLLSRADGIAQVVPAIVSPDELPPYDLHCPMLSLPLLFETRPATVPATTPYLKPEHSLLQKWGAKIAFRAGPFKVGLAWAGSPTNKNDRYRSVTLEQLVPLAGCGATFYSLQTGPAAAQASSPPPGMDLVNLTAGLEDFADTAALIAGLDLVITVDTAVAHLAGALGKPVWALLASEQDWRWLLDRPDTPWYPTMRLFRQTAPGHWPAVIATVARELAACVGGARRAA